MWMRMLVRQFVMMLAILVLCASIQAQDATRWLPKTARATTLQVLHGDETLVSASGRPLQIFSFTNRNQQTSAGRHQFLIQGGLHGNEALTPEFVTWLAKRYARGESLLNHLPSAEVTIDFLPHANPDGIAEKNRYNARGVNLNRNFGILWGLTRENPGAKSFSEPETRAIDRLLQQRRYTAAIDVHGYINWIVAPSDPETLARHQGSRNLTPRRIARYHRWIRSLGQEIRSLTGYELKTAGGLGDGGAFEDWAYWSYDTLALCLELESSQRFEAVDRQTSVNQESDQGAFTVDRFHRYERFIARVFTRAIAIDQAYPAPSIVAVQP